MVWYVARSSREQVDRRWVWRCRSNSNNMMLRWGLVLVLCSADLPGFHCVPWWGQVFR